MFLMRVFIVVKYITRVFHHELGAYSHQYPSYISSHPNERHQPRIYFYSHICLSTNVLCVWLILTFVYPIRKRVYGFIYVQMLLINNAT